jgi:hypothetical protein
MSFFIELITLLDIVASTYVFANAFLSAILSKLIRNYMISIHFNWRLNQFELYG